MLVGGTTFVGGLLAAPFDVEAVPPAPKSVLLLAADGTQFGQIRASQRQELIAAEDIPDIMRQAIISAEDARFLDHKGVDPSATLRAAYRDIFDGARQGGSTITQQYVKNNYVGDDRTLLRKVQEAAIAVRLESRKSKDDILTDYLNVIFLGNSTYGIQAAAKYYFGVDVKDLDLDETPGRGNPRDAGLALARASMLAGIAPAPSAWNPVTDFRIARLRQKYTLNQMVLNGYIDSRQASEAFTREAAVMPLRETEPEPPSTAPEYADLVTAQLRKRYEGDQDLLDRGGFRVQTALDTDLQEAVTRAAREVLPDADDPQAAVVAVDFRNGDVKAMTTLRRFPQRGENPALENYERGGYNLASNAMRSAGSTIKPFTLAVALEQGLSLDTRRPAPSVGRIPDASAPGGVYQYFNASGESGPSRGSLTLQAALKASVNTVYVPLAIEVGRPRIKQLMLDAGVVANDDVFATAPNSFGLGTTAEVTPLSMANAYGAFANGGLHADPRFITGIRGADGAMIADEAAGPAPTQVMPADVAARMVEAMSGVTTPGGTAQRARQDFTVFGKTGTTNDSTDAWFIGCAKDPYNVCIATWMGFEFQNCQNVVGTACGGMKNVNGVPQVFGGTLPAAIFARTFEILREIQAGKAAAAAQEAGVAPVASPAAAAEPSPTTRRTRAPATAPVDASPEPVATVAPVVAPEPSLSPEPARSPSPPPPPPPRPLIPRPSTPAATPDNTTSPD